MNDTETGVEPARSTSRIARMRDTLPRGLTLPVDEWERRHRWIVGLLWLHIPALFTFALLQGNSVAHSAFEGSVVGTFAVCATLAKPHSRRVAATLAALGVLTASAVLVHLSGGKIEAHFHFFVMVSVLVLYEDWLVFMTALAYVVLQHGVAGAIDPSSVYNHLGATKHPWRWAGIHGFFIACLSAANIVSWRLNEQTRGKMRDSEERFRDAFEMAPIGMALIGTDTRFLRVNHALCELTGYSQAELVGQSALIIRPPESQTTDLVGVKDMLATLSETYRGEQHFRRADGEMVWAEIAVTPRRPHAGAPAHLIVQFLDVTERRRAAERLAHMALHDPLTELPNHGAFHEAVEREVARGPVAIVSLGLDGLKGINDTHGHSFGDELLRSVGRALREVAPDDALVARVGGDEFALVLPGLGAELAFAVAESARAALGALSTQGVEIRASGGVAGFPEDAGDAARLVHLSEAALYQVKREGGDNSLRWDAERVTFSLTVAEQRREIEAVLRRDDALVPVFQPLVELASGTVIGYEALARFHHGPPRPPDAWFAQAHRCGLGPELETRALELALATPDRPEGAHLSLNLSPSALISEHIWTVLPADCHEIVIEVTEHELATEERALVSALDELRRRGAQIAVDDAGAGYAGLQQVMRLQPDIIKLDRALTDGVSGDPAKVALIESFVRFASRTGALVCAEGIETMDDLKVLADLDVAWGQGYGLARPAEPWADVSPEATEACCDSLFGALREGGGIAELDFAGDARLERVTSRLAGVRSLADLTGLTSLVAAELGADKVAFSVLNEGEGYVQAVGSEDWREDGERYPLDEYPATRHALESHEAVQILTRDARADRAEVELLARDGFESLLMLPMISHGRPLGLLEAYSHQSRPWTRAQINRGRIVCNQFAAVLESFGARQLDDVA